jgi:hypothetical protein
MHAKQCNFTLQYNTRVSSKGASREKRGDACTILRTDPATHQSFILTLGHDGIIINKSSIQ